jgi:hypothetical protein
MKRILTILLITVLFLTACAVQYNVAKPAEEQNQAERPTIAVDLKPDFKITSQQAIRNPPTIKGTIKNNGLGSGDATLVGRIYYAGVVADERTTKVDNLKSEEEANFTIVFDKIDQWTSYSVHIE